MGLSTKQIKILTFGASRYDALICDGAVRSGKTSIMSIAFVLWMMANFDNQSFAFCGKTVGTVERNIIGPLLNVRYITDNYDLQYSRSTRVLTVRRGRKTNRIYLFGGKDESSYMPGALVPAGVDFATCQTQRPAPTLCAGRQPRPVRAH